jgi:NADP-dependent 3-hydroxy acid dehydrogenase YdfG
MQSRGGVFVVVQDTGGAFGLERGADPTRAWLGGLVALARTAAREWPRAAVKAIDCATAGRAAPAVAEAIVAELVGGAGAPEVGLRADGSRMAPELVDAPVRPASPRIGPHSVVVATGGARGVTAAGLLRLAGQRHPRLVLIGRTPLTAEPDGLASAVDEAGVVRLLAQRRPGSPAQLAARAREVLAVREVRATLAALERDGVTARYVAVDVGDAGELTRALDEVRRDWGPVTVVVHGAGVLADARIADKTDEQVARVFDPKIGGLHALLAATADDPLEVLCAYSSVASVFGNAGQVDYAMSNETLNHVLAAERARRPECLVRAIAWGPWRGGMVTPTLAERFRDGGVALIEPDAGAEALVSELDGSADDVLAIVTAPDDGPAPATDDLVAEVVVDARQYPYLDDHRLGGVPVVPVAAVLDWFARAAVAWRSNGAATVIRDLRVLDKIALPRLADGGHRLLLRGHRATAEDGPALDLDLRDDAGRPHYRASVVDAGAPAAARWSAPPGLEPTPDPYGSTTLFHGPALQALRGRPAVGPDGADGVVAGSPAMGWADGVGEVDVAAVDGALQLALLWARRAGAGDTLPMGVGEIRLRRRDGPDSETRCIVRAVRVDDAGAVCDVGLVDAHGVPRVELLGVRLVRRPGS